LVHGFQNVLASLGVNMLLQGDQSRANS